VWYGLKFRGFEWNWVEFSQVESNWVESNWVKLSQIEPNWVKLSQIESNWVNWVKLSQIESNWVKLRQIESNWVKLSPIMSQIDSIFDSKVWPIDISHFFKAHNSLSLILISNIINYMQEYSLMIYFCMQQTYIFRLLGQIGNHLFS
jgi:hypothetical protein